MINRKLSGVGALDGLFVAMRNMKFINNNDLSNYFDIHISTMRAMVKSMRGSDGKIF